ncbi:unnamed protein product, partial [Brassica oleracea]
MSGDMRRIQFLTRRISLMLVDISFWALSSPLSNIIVLSKKILGGTLFFG